MAEDTNPLDTLLARVRELTAEGYDHSQAWGTADLERRISIWPEQWGDDLEILIYGVWRLPTAGENDLGAPTWNHCLP